MENAVPKIEGHATFYAHLKAGKIDEARVIGLDGERFVEKILVGRKFFEAPIITSRICGICPVIHNVTSTRAIEDAIGISPTPQTVLLRKLMLCGQMIQSHSLHLYLLVLPDFFGCSSSFELQKNHPDLFQNAISLKRFSDFIVEKIGGRAVHPVANVPGGFKHFPSQKDLTDIIEMSKINQEIAIQTLKLFFDLSYPDIHRAFNYCALKKRGEYAYYDGTITGTSGESFEANEYKNYIYEELVPYNPAKFATLRGKEIEVGAIARLNLSSQHLHPEVLTLIKEKNLTLPLDNPFQNTIAQAIENLHFIIETGKIAENLKKDGIKEEKIIEPKSFGIGTGASEAPRGTLFHHYELDKEGFIHKADVITPTVQNLPSMESDMIKLNKIIKDKTKSERDRLIEMLIRAYDPCITCATH